MASNNNIGLFQKYVDQLDKVFQWAAITSVLDGDASLTRQGTNTNEIIIPKMVVDGLGDYSRKTGYTDGTVTLDYETVKFNYDRGRRFSVDAMDNEESAGLAFGQLAGEFVRTKAAPELDTWRFAQYAGTTGISSDSGTIANGDALLTTLIDAQNYMDENEVPRESRMLFITPTLHRSILALETYKSKEVMSEFSSIKEVPQRRFYTAIDLLNGKDSGEEAGHYRKNADGKDINFFIIHKPALLQYRKHLVSKVISPQLNQRDDDWMFFYRSYGLADVYENKVDGLFLHHKA